MAKVVILCGPPGSGKSTVADQALTNYTYINQDTQGKDHLRLFFEALSRGENIVVDRMNFDKAQRARYLVPAKEAGYETEISVIHQPRKVCFDRMMKRQNHPTIKDASSANSALNVFFSKYEKPLPGEADFIQFVYDFDIIDPAIIVDLDGTLCNVDHRLHHVRKPQGEKKNWKAFFDDLALDQPNEWCAAIVNQMSKKMPVVFASGRPDDHERQTRAWLEKFDFPTNHLYMRCRGDHRQDYVAKEIILDFEILTRFKPFFFIDDRKQVVDLWRNRGYVCLHCAEGDF